MGKSYLYERQTEYWTAVGIEARCRYPVKIVRQLDVGFGQNKIAVHMDCLSEDQPTREFSVIIEKDEDGYFVASVPALRGCHAQAKSLDTLMKRIKEAIELCLEVEEPVSNEFIGVQKVAIVNS